MSDEPLYCVQCGYEWGDDACPCENVANYDGPARFCHYCSYAFDTPNAMGVCAGCDKELSVDRPGRDERGPEVPF